MTVGTLRVVVVGGGASGMSAASRVKRLLPKADVKVFERSGFVSYAPCGIPYLLGGVVGSLDKLVHYSVDFFRERRGIDVHVHASVEDAGKDYVEVSEGGRSKRYDWDVLVLATGARPVVPPIPGVELEGVLTLRNLEDGAKAKEMLARAERVGVVGGGYIGLEVAENLVRLGKKVLMFEMLPHIMPTLDHDVAKRVERELVEYGVELHLSEKVVEFGGGERVSRVVTEKGSYDVDLVFMAVGVRPDTALAERLGLKLGETRAVWTDSRMRTSLENVYAVGDVAETVNLVTGKRDWIPLAPAANKMGFVAGSNIAGMDIEFPGVVGTAITKAFGLEIGRTGLSEAQAKRLDYDVVSVSISAKTRAGYYPEPKAIKVKLVAEAESGRLLGAQVVGYEGVLARINTVAALLPWGATVRDLFFADLAYAPPFAPVWDPLVVAARVLMKKLH